MKKRGQVWIETVIYTLIAFALIGAALGFIKPKIQEMQDKTLIEQSAVVLEDIDSIISSIKGTAGNIRIVEVMIKKGSFQIDSTEDKIIFELDGKSEYSEIGQEIKRGIMTILTEKLGNENKVTLTVDYSNEYDIKYNGGDSEKKLLNKSPNPYKISIENKGIQDDKIVLDIKIL